MPVNNYHPSAEDLRQAHKIFLEKEPRDLFYRVATELIELAIVGKTKLTLSDSLAVLLQTWNKAYYQFRPHHFDNKHFQEINYLVQKYAEELITGFRNRSILSFTDRDEDKVNRVFKAFEEVLGPTGAAKSLHLLAPRFFPLWDRKIAKGYGLAMRRTGMNANRYCSFMNIAHIQSKKLQGTTLAQENNLLKLLDEYNYCHSKGWI